MGKNMKDPFLTKVLVSCEADAMRNSLRAALQHNPFYCCGIPNKQRSEIRKDWASVIIACIGSYKNAVTEEKHIEHIDYIARSISDKHKRSLRGGRLRIGTSQEAFNLYLKFLWRLGKIATPPHCPVDGIILKSAKVLGSWTASDSIDDYRKWIIELKKVASPQSLADWEYELWNKEA
jgi:hypothetical protein